MTQDEIIKMARQAGFKSRVDEFYSEFCDGVYFDDLEAFAKLVAAKAIAELESQEPVIDKSAATRIATSLGWSPQRTWIGLTDEDIAMWRPRFKFSEALIREVEAKLKEKNNA
jgi:hypothetical protein